MFKFLFLILTLTSSSAVLSQENGDSNNMDRPGFSTTIKIDEFGPLAECDRTARLDALASALQADPDAKGYIIVYQGEDLLPSKIENPDYAKNLYVDYLTENRAIPADRIVLINSNRKETVTELWIVPQNAAPPAPTGTIEKIKIPTDKTFLYDTAWLGFYSASESSLELLLPDKRAEYEETFKPDEESAEIVEQETTSEAIELSDEEEDELKFGWTSERFGDFLSRNKKMRGVIVFYADDREYDINKVSGRIEEGKMRIAEQSKIAPGRIQVIFGGYKNSVEIEFWAVPEKGNFPEPKPDERIIEDETEPKIQ